VSESTLYIQAAEELRDNPGQWQAYDSTDHCVIIAGPGSGKTKTLTIKLARMLAEDVWAPRGIACITYSNETARELETRLQALGIESRRRVFIGTVHSFALTQIVLPYAKTARLGLPDDFRVATTLQQKAAFQAAVQRLGANERNVDDLRFDVNRHRRSILDRASEAWLKRDPELSTLVEEYEGQLRRRRLIDFEDMPLLAVRALRQHAWLRRAILAKYPILVVDEYQDLGRALDAMVRDLCFNTGIRIFAVGDVDQSIYGFNGAHPELLEQLARRPDVETIRLRYNYRCGTRIVAGSQYALGEDRDYEACDGAPQGRVVFHPCNGSYADHANALFAVILPTTLQRLRDVSRGQVAILYVDAGVGDTLVDAARRYGFDVVRTDKNALYPRTSSLMRWLELCAVWCSGGWRTGTPRFSSIVNQGSRLFSEALQTDADRIDFQRQLLKALWNTRDERLDVHAWLERLRDNVLAPFAARCRTVGDEMDNLDAFIDRTGDGGDVVGITVGQFAGYGDGNVCVTLSTFHSAKGREFALVVLFGIDDGRLPRNNATATGRQEARRTFYVGFTRARREVHIMYSAARPSPFVVEVRDNMARDGQ
jgi:DNA helicase-2/ATP-dependent DNA helicase PcrA